MVELKHKLFCLRETDEIDSEVYYLIGKLDEQVFKDLIREYRRREHTILYILLLLSNVGLKQVQVCRDTLYPVEY